MNCLKFLCAAFLAIVCGQAVADPPEVRAAFDFRSRTFLEEYAARGGRTKNKAYYPRVKRLSDGSLLLVYMDGKFGWNIYARRSDDDGLSWSDPVCVRRSYRDRTVNDMRCYACPDFAELPDGDILLAFQWRYSQGYADSLRGNESCGIEVMRSRDAGRSFDPASVREVFRGRCWEPSFVVRHSGEIQLFFTGVQHYCHTAMIRSFDGGYTWTPSIEQGKYEAEHISRSIEKGLSMNGMPVGVCLDGGRGTAVAMESMKGKVGGDLTPLIVWSSEENNWRYEDFKPGDIGPDSARKWLVHRDFVGYAPYMAKLPDGLVALQSNGKFRGRSGMWLFIGDPSAREFAEPSSGYGGWWGSIAGIGADTLMSASNREYGPDGKCMGIMISKAYLNRSMQVSEPLPHRVEEGMYKGRYDWFVGASSQAQAVISAGLERRCLELLVTVRDEDMHVGDDGFDRVCPLDGETPRTDGVVICLRRGDGAGMHDYKVIITADGGCRLWCDGRVVPGGCKASENMWRSGRSGRSAAEGYRYVLSVPWKAIGGRPFDGESLNMFVRVLNLDGDGFHTDDMQGVDPDDPSSWLSVVFGGPACKR